MHTPSGYLLLRQCLFDLTKNMLECYRDKDCMKRFCKNLKEHETKIISYERKKENDAPN